MPSVVQHHLSALTRLLHLPTRYALWLVFASCAHACFHSVSHLREDEIDGASKGKNKSHFKKDFAIEILYAPVEPTAAATAEANVLRGLAPPMQSSMQLLLSLPGDPPPPLPSEEPQRSPRSPRGAMLVPASLSPRGPAGSGAGGSAFNTKMAPPRPSSPMPPNRTTATTGATVPAHALAGTLSPAAAANAAALNASGRSPLRSPRVTSEP